MKNFTKFSLLAMLIFTSLFANAQMMNDGIFMAKGSLCGGITYTNDSWKNYWEGSLYRENKNMGTVTTQSVALMGNYGISDKLNVLFSLPYITTKPSAGVLHGMSGVQDLTLAVKYRLVQAGNLSVIGSVGGSIPTNNYVADFMPFSIGNQSKTVFARGILYYTLPANLALTVNGVYTSRANVRVDREMYYSDKGYFTNEMIMPDVVNFGAKLGHYSYRWQLEGTYDQQVTGGSIDIRRNDMPGLCNKFDYTRVGFIASYRVPALKDLQIMITGGKILSGRNVGESTTFSIGLSKIVGFSKNKTSDSQNRLICRPGDNHGGMEMKKEEHK
ncbi:outer membrane putative beta-barrel porin/alpha-amylase [Arcicella aurantiaca]|uniref:Outer membrane putative beta-barrel porin/alpha-amylase n=1 Tax=Arcicella aurantiaca TaxID=591202 RepID=A0A316EF18_9BACT|nr:transporter [Arcicella aurantiaca]PWK29180.1 outer membrane putative beta-barrel porin/alpha-amylase [Arcicella aurantiaca]